MIGDLSLTLKALLQALERPEVVREAEVAFDPPGASYPPSVATINLFLYDVREDVQLRTNVADWDSRTSEIRRPPYRLACSYLVTTWPGTALSGDAAILAQHRMLGEVARVLSGMAEIDDDYRQGVLATQPYPIPLTMSHGEPTSNPAQFWAAIGGKLQPSITLTATIALEPDVLPVTAYPVSTRTIVLNAEVSHRIGGTVRDSRSTDPVADVALELLDLGVKASSDADGRFTFAVPKAGTYQLHATRTGYVAVTRTITVPGDAPTAFDFPLTPTP